MTLDELYTEFDDMEDWEEQCDFLIDLGFELPDFPDDARTDENIVRGCQSRVWLIAETDASAAPATITIKADSDAIIVKGLIAVLLMTYSGKTAQEIVDTDIHAVFGRLGLDRHLSSQRKNGLLGMVKRVQGIAQEALAG